MLGGWHFVFHPQVISGRKDSKGSSYHQFIDGQLTLGISGFGGVQ